jgi:hypothetical protein
VASIETAFRELSDKIAFKESFLGRLWPECLHDVQFAPIAQEDQLKAVLSEGFVVGVTFFHSLSALLLVSNEQRRNKTSTNPDSTTPNRKPCIC